MDDEIYVQRNRTTQAAARRPHDIRDCFYCVDGTGKLLHINTDHDHWLLQNDPPTMPCIP